MLQERVIDLSLYNKFSRRRFISTSALGAMGFAVLSCAGNNSGEQTPTQQPINFKEDLEKVPGGLEVIHQPETAAVKIRIGKQESVPLLSDIPYFPDAQFATRRRIVDGSPMLDLWVPGGVGTYGFSGPDMEHLQSYKLDKKGNPAPIFGPDPSIYFIQDYAGITSVFQFGDDPNELVGFGHGENRPEPDDSSHYWANVFRVVSHDGGKTWKNPELVIAGMNIDKSHRRISGAGQPKFISVEDEKSEDEKSKEFLYGYGTDWNALGPDAIHLYRAPLDQGGKPGTWEGYTKNNGFTPFVIDANGNGSKTDSIITPPVFNGVGSGYAALVSVSWNTSINKLLGIFDTSTGFCSAVSFNGKDWDNYQLLLKKPNKKDKDYKGYMYPMAVSESEKSDRITSGTGNLYYAVSEAGIAPHFMYRRPFFIEK